MAVTWIKKSEEKGSATLSNSYVVINQLFADKFAKAYSALLGVDEENNIIFKPLSLDECELPKFKDSVLLKVNIFNSFVRLGNTASMKVISELLNLDLGKSGIKFETYWNEKEKALVVKTGGGQ